jgi:outer membrane biosynthesis protein TonB
VRDLLKEESNNQQTRPELARKPRGLQLGIWVFAFSLIAFGLFCIMLISPDAAYEAGPAPLKNNELTSDNRVPIGSAETLGQPTPLPSAQLPASSAKPVSAEPTVQNERQPEVPKPFTATTARPTEPKQKIKVVAQHTDPRRATKPRIEPDQQMASTTKPILLPSSNEASASQTHLGTSSGMPSQSVYSTQTSGKGDVCSGTAGLAREQCQQCDARSGWLFKLNCEAQVKIKFCSGREGRHVECPPNYNTPG